MSARLDFIDHDAGVVWVSYEGRGDELATNLRVYCVDFVPSLRVGRVGIPFRTPLRAETAEVLTDAAVGVVDLLTVRRGVTKREEREFGSKLITIQSFQSRAESQQARDLSAWVSSRRRFQMEGAR